MKIIIDDAIPFLEGRLPEEAEKIIMPGAEIKASDVKDADILLVRTRTRCDAALLKDSKVKLVATGTIGADHFNLPELNALGIEAVNSPGCNAPAVAQYVWSSLLREGFKPGRDKLGLVGKGHVGSIVAEWGRKLGAEVLVCDPPRCEKGYADEDYKTLEQLCEECDAITLHVPLTRVGKHATAGLFDEHCFSLFKDGAILVNASRGGVVDEESWKKAIREKGIVAVVDTWKGEPHQDKELMSMAKIATPHIAGYSLQGKKRATRMILEAIERKFDLKLPLSGLEPAYCPLGNITEQMILNSYDPYKDMALFMSQPDSFEQLRDGYALRDEVSET